MMNFKHGCIVLCAGILSLVQLLAAQGQRWTEAKANQWLDRTGWLVGCNFNPSTAINQLEMWQADTFDPATMDRELAWAEQLGFNSVRVFLHDIPWRQDSKGFLNRLERFLQIADRHKIGVMFVLFDSVWHPYPKPGPQPAPKPFVHNSGWVQSPGLDILKDPARHDELKGYVTGIIGHFRNDRRVQVWDLFNEPDNRNNSSYGQFEPENKADLALQLLRKTFAWAREVNPSQPLTAGVWIGNWADPAKLSPMERFCLEQSDVISFHCYGPLEEMQRCVNNLRRYNRPILCTEYMARPQGSTFDPILGYLKQQKVAAYNWGFVDGKTQTIFPWDSWRKPYTNEPPLWFHDIFRRDGTPYKADEVEYIKRVTGKK
ncbi:cellulase family glycosylhydrolase [Fontisphaera persica]|uniref:cellulase family glycosylhydrolase n=1 Tax=Fontisphaera persica TaxID=2974023 RepID=UPI0024C096A0|nr:glycosyl hydrolase [Fontisphaera persica]WCJ60156.1 cellulase family glycosylhydrolase [Fontisphaera persica]